MSTMDTRRTLIIESNTYLCASLHNRKESIPAIGRMLHVVNRLRPTKVGSQDSRIGIQQIIGCVGPGSLATYAASAVTTVASATVGSERMR